MLAKVTKFAYAVKETSSENVIHNLQLQFKHICNPWYIPWGRLVLITEPYPRHDVSEKAVGRKLLMKLKIFRGKLIDEGVPALIPPNLPENKVESMKTSGREGKKCLPKLLLYLK